MRRLLSLVGFGRVGAFELSVTAGASVLQRLAVPCLNVCFGRFVAEKSAQRSRPAYVRRASDSVLSASDASDESFEY